MDTHTLQQLLNKYLSGTAAEAETGQLYEWYNAFNDELVTVPADTAGEEWQTKKRLQDRLEQMLADNKKAARPARIVSFRWYKVAAAILFLLAAGFVWYIIEQNRYQEKFTQFVATDKKILTVRLPDSSTVVLNSGSRLRLPEDFNKINRTVLLEGEAYFRVTHNPAKPFRVLSGSMGTQVLGTSFNVRAWPKDRIFSVTVLTGKVWVGLVKNVNAKKAEDMKLEQKVVLLPNDKVVLQVAGQVFTQSKVADAQTTTDWQKGYLLFDQTPMADVAEALHRAYGIQVELQNPDIANCKLFGRFPKDQPVERQMEYIAGVTGTMYEKKNDSTYLLKGEGCRP